MARHKMVLSGFPPDSNWQKNLPKDAAVTEYVMKDVISISERHKIMAGVRNQRHSGNCRRGVMIIIQPKTTLPQ